MTTPPAHADSPFLAACRGEAPAHTPVWFMRQAGRSLPEYRALRERASLLEIVRTPELAVEVTAQPVRRHGVDAAILFSDIVVPLAAVGVDLEIRPGVGPVIARPVRSAADVARLRPLEPEADVPYVLETIRALAATLPVPLIGFAGAPFTLASYLVEGGPSRTHARTKAFMLGEPVLWRDLVDRLADIVLASLRAQVAAGAAAVQLFDSWAGALTPAQYRTHVLPASARIFAGLADLGVPRVHFGVTTGELLAAMAEAGPDVLGVDWRLPLDLAFARVGRPGLVLQGNLDPAVLLAPEAEIDAEVDDVLARGGDAVAAGAGGHVFNLGHGVLPETPPDALTRVVARVHERTRRAA